MNSQTKQGKKITRKLKSVKLASEELSKLIEFVAPFPNQDLAAEAVGLNNRRTLTNIIRGGSGSPDSIKAIRRRLKRVA